jgi:hypothetical protein
MLNVLRKVDSKVFYEILMMKSVCLIRPQTIARSRNVILRCTDRWGGNRHMMDYVNGVRLFLSLKACRSFPENPHIYRLHASWMGSRIEIFRRGIIISSVNPLEAQVSFNV